MKSTTCTQLAIIQSSLYNFILFCDCATPLIENELPHSKKNLKKGGKGQKKEENFGS